MRGLTSLGTIFRSDRPSVAILTSELRLVPVQLGTCRLLAVGPVGEFTEEYPLQVVL